MNEARWPCPSALAAWAREKAQAVKGRAYLVGSALHNPSPRDIDIRIMLVDVVFEQRYGSIERWRQEGTTGQWTEIRRHWSKECTALTKEGWHLFDRNLDVQVEPESEKSMRYPNDPWEVIG